MLSDRMLDVPKSFIREILKVAADGNIISFAGGLPNPDFFPIEAFRVAADYVLKNEGAEALQYSSTEGYLPLRQYISDRYKKNKGLEIDPDEILITSGSQQGMDLMGKTFLNEGDEVAVEDPSYLGAIQCFSMYKAKFHTIPLHEDGIDIERFAEVIQNEKIKLFYTVPNFQNPSGITYTDEKRRQVTDILRGTKTLLLEDDPYGELRFIGSDVPPMKTYRSERSIILGSFSKTAAPGFRLGWLAAPREMMEKIIVAKQASDLHSNYFCQRVLYRYLLENDLDEHIETIKEAYGKQREVMVEMIAKYFPEEVSYTKPEGGMFLWATLPKGLSSLELFDQCIKKGVAFVPGAPFYANGGGKNTLRLNYSNVNAATIEEGIKRIGETMKEML